MSILQMVLTFLLSLLATLLLFLWLVPPIHISDGSTICINGVVRTEYAAEPVQAVICGILTVPEQK